MGSYNWAHLVYRTELNSHCSMAPSLHQARSTWRQQAFQWAHILLQFAQSHFEKSSLSVLETSSKKCFLKNHKRGHQVLIVVQKFVGDDMIGLLCCSFSLYWTTYPINNVVVSEYRSVSLHIFLSKSLLSSQAANIEQSLPVLRQSPMCCHPLK